MNQESHRIGEHCDQSWSMSSFARSS